MSWKSGSTLFGDLMNALTPKITTLSTAEKQAIVSALIECFEDYDCDTIYELRDAFPLIDEHYKERETDA